MSFCLSGFFGSRGGFRTVRKAHFNNFFLFSSKSGLLVASCDPQSNSTAKKQPLWTCYCKSTYKYTPSLRQQPANSPLNILSNTPIKSLPKHAVKRSPSRLVVDPSVWDVWCIGLLIHGCFLFSPCPGNFFVECLCYSSDFFWVSSFECLWVIRLWFFS